MIFFLSGMVGPSKSMYGYRGISDLKAPEVGVSDGDSVSRVDAGEDDGKSEFGNVVDADGRCCEVLVRGDSVTPSLMFGSGCHPKDA
mmetsp:Transcript_69889/g.110907  ORF Transcript_69889/g.110907 Transcript_69889/m.110907 type:complete len:87 (-) Transcript_69889:312-572(-)